jgi:glycosyltransferase involved in cell wall biosynthesis
VSHRVGIDARMWRHTGIGRYVSSLVPRFAARGDLELVAWVAPADLGDAYAAWRGVTVRPCPAPLFSAREQLFWRDELRAARLDLFHAPHLNAPLAPAVPLVVTLHDLIPLRYPGTHNSRAGAAYFRGMTALVPRVARLVLTHSDATRRDLVAMRGVPDAKIRVVPLAADPRFAEPAEPARRAAVRARHGLDGPFVLYAGQWKRYKNLETLLQAFARVAPDRPGLRLVLAGREDPHAAHVPATIQALGLADRVVTTGWIADDADLVALYQEARAFAFPSRYEGFGLPPLEAMAAGTPVVSSDGGALAEAVGDAALVADPDDVGAWARALATALDDEPARARLVEAGRARVRALGWDRTADATAAAYHEALGR